MLNDFSHWISKKKKRKYSKPLKKWCRRILANRRKNKQRKTPNKSTSIKIIKIPYSPLHSITSTGVRSWLIFISRVELLLRSPWFSVNFSIFGLILSSSSFALTLPFPPTTRVFSGLFGLVFAHSRNTCRDRQDAFIVSKNILRNVDCCFGVFVCQDKLYGFYGRERDLTHHNT